MTNINKSPLYAYFVLKLFAHTVFSRNFALALGMEYA